VHQLEESKVYEALQDMTGGISPDACINCVGLEAHSAFADNIWDQIKVSTFLGTDRAHVIRQIILAARRGGRVSMPGVYGGFADKFPLGQLMEKGLTLKTGQTPSRSTCARSTPRSRKASSIPRS